MFFNIWIGPVNTSGIVISLVAAKILYALKGISLIINALNWNCVDDGMWKGIIRKYVNLISSLVTFDYLRHGTKKIISCLNNCQLYFYDLHSFSHDVVNFIMLKHLNIIRFSRFFYKIKGEKMVGVMKHLELINCEELK